ncbi:MAG TPA: hypothetical protein VLM11_00545 [Streptosporangiaceae bacterium]|nr:hypothetical protein [Streptosporangiaceae bacterium]
MHEPATASVGVQSGHASRTTHAAASDYGAMQPDHSTSANPDRRFKYEQMVAEIPALPRLESTYPSGHGDLPAHPQFALPPISVDLASDAGERLPGPPDKAALPPNGRWIAVVAAILVVFVTAVLAIALAGHYHVTAAGRLADKVSAAARPSRSAPASAVPESQGPVSVYPAAATEPNEAAVVASLNRYFDAINHHDYGVYKRLFLPRLRGGLSAASFSAGFGTTTASVEQLHSINVTGAGEVEALVTFISHQAIAGQPTTSACTAWSIEFYLVRPWRRYLLAARPRWYQASTSSCP